MRRSREWLQNLVRNGFAEVSCETRSTVLVSFNTRNGRRVLTTVWFTN